MVSNVVITSASEKSACKPERYLRTVLLVISWLNLGLSGEIIGPTMRVLASNAHVTFTGIGTVLACRSVGGLFANILCGIFQKLVKNHSDLLITLAFLFSAILVCSTPYIHSLVLLCAVFFLQGLSGSFANMGGTNLLLSMWGNRAGTSLNLVHFGYGFGAMAANLLARPFLNKEDLHGTDIRIPYQMISGLCILIGTGHLIFFLRRRRQVRPTQADYAPVSTAASNTSAMSGRSKYSPANCGHGHFAYGLIMSVMFLLYMFFVAGTEQVFAKFYFSYLKFDKFNISTNGASWSIVCFWLTFSFGRLVGALVCMFVSAYVCLSVVWCGGLFLAATWLVYVWVLGLTGTSLFVLGSLTGLVIGPLFPLSFAWISKTLNPIPALLAAIFCFGGFGSLTLQKIAGFVMDRDPNHFPTLLTGCVIVSIGLYIVASGIIFLHRRRLKTSDSLTVESPSGEDEQQVSNYLQSVSET